MKPLDKILMGIFHRYTDGDYSDTPKTNFFLGRLAMTLPAAILILLIFGVIREFAEKDFSFLLPYNNFTSLLFLFLLYPAVHFLTSKNSDILEMLKSESEDNLKKYMRVFIAVLGLVALVFIVTAVVLRG